MDTVGLRDLKNNLSRHLQRVRQGKRLIVTDRGKSIAVIAPAPATDDRRDVGWIWELVSEGKVTWNGGKPRGSAKPPAVAERPTLSDMVIEDRR